MGLFEWTHYQNFDHSGPIVIGVVAPGFELLLPPNADTERKPDAWYAVRLRHDNTQRDRSFLYPIARLRPGVSIDQAQAQADRVSAELRRNFELRETSGFNIGIEAMDRHLVEAVRPAILALLGAVIFLLLIACANVANLLLVRASLREREYAVRTALGAAWWSLARQTMAEVLLIAALGSAAGVALSSVGLKQLLAIAPPDLPRLDSVSISPRVLAFAALAGLVAAVIFGLAPIVHMRRPDVMQVLRTDGRSPGLAGGSGLLRNAVVVAEVALCYVLLIGSGLMLRSFIALRNVDPGFDPNGLFQFTLGIPEISPEARAALQDRLPEAFRTLPGVTRASATSEIPLSGDVRVMRWGTEEALSDPSKFKAYDGQFVLEDYFETMRTPMIDGRGFTEQEIATKSKVAVIDQILAAKAFGGASAIGKRILVRLRAAGEFVEVVGVVGHQRVESLVEPGREQLYLPDALGVDGYANTWVLRARTGDPAQLFAQVKDALATVNSRFVMVEPGPMSELVERAQAPTRFQMSLIATFAVIAVILAAVGLYGVLSTMVRQRTAEIGVRMALGAAPSSVITLIVRHGLRLSAIGLLLGVIAGLVLTRLISTMLVDVKPADPVTYVVVGLGFLAISTVVAWIPAKRAAALDPMQALRDS